MGGPASYFGQVKDKPRLGPAGEWDRQRLEGLFRLALRGAMLAAGLLYFYKVLVSLA